MTDTHPSRWWQRISILEYLQQQGWQPASNQGAFVIYPGEDLPFFPEDEHVNVNCAWMAWTADNADGVLSILNFTSNNPAVTNPPMPLASLNQGSSIASPNGSGVLLTTASLAAIGANAQRRGLTFHNPGTVNHYVCPANLAAVEKQHPNVAKMQSRLKKPTRFFSLALCSAGRAD